MQCKIGFTAGVPRIRRRDAKAKGVCAGKVDLRIDVFLQGLTGGWCIELGLRVLGRRIIFSNGLCASRRLSSLWRRLRFPRGPGQLDRSGLRTNFVRVRRQGLPARAHAKTASAHLTPFPLLASCRLPPTPRQNGNGALSHVQKSPV